MFEQLVDAIAVVRDFDASACSDAELNEVVAELTVLTERLEAATTRVTGAWDARRCWDADRARTGAAWLAWRCHLDNATARRRIRLARALRTLPATESAWLAGAITATHAGVMMRAHNERTTEPMIRDENDLVRWATDLRFAQFNRIVTYWLWRADPDGVEHRAERDHADRHCHASVSFRDNVFGEFRLDPTGGAAFLDVLTSIEHELFETDWAAARAEHGADTSACDLARTPPQRRADALVEMARRAASMPPDARRPAPLFTVLVGYETFAGPMCELASGAMVPPGSLLRWLDDAYVERVVFDSPSRVIDVGERQRLFSGALRRAIQVRDRTCYEPVCDDTNPDRMQIDHIQPFTNGGPTTQTNGRLACAYHNRLRHRHP